MQSYARVLCWIGAFWLDPCHCQLLAEITERETQRLETSNGSKVFLWPILAKNVESPLGLLKISALRLQSKAQQRHQTSLDQRKLLCLKVIREKEKILHRAIQSSSGSLNLFVKGHLQQQERECHIHANSIRSINFDCHRKISQVKWK